MKKQQSARYREALAAYERGWLLTPLDGKRPTKKGWNKEPAPDLATVRGWARDRNVGVRTGEASGLVVIDIDPRNGGDHETLNLPKTITASTGGGGSHLYFKYPSAKI